MNFIPSNDVELISKFFLVFSRFEYALKAAGWAKAGRNNTAWPDWDKVMKKLQEAKDRDPVFDKAGILFTEPPKRQILENDQLCWRKVKPSGNRSQQLIRSVKCVRNNLFHGGKYNDQQIVFTPRQVCLVTAALEVLMQLLIMPSLAAVKQKFDEPYTPEEG